MANLNSSGDVMRVLTALSAADGPPKPRPGEHFLAGPWPMSWISAASRSGRTGLHVGLWLWLRAFITKSNVVVLGTRDLRLLGVGREGVAKGLDALEITGLVSVVREPGRKARVRILEAPPIPRWRSS